MTNLALASDMKLPIYYNGECDLDLRTGTFTFTIGQKTYATDGIIGLEMRHKLVWCRSYEFVVYGAEVGHPQAEGTPKEHYFSDYENSEDDAVESAESLQAQCARETGMVYPIWRRE